MNWQDFITAMKAIPSSTVEAWNKNQTYWREAHPVLKVLELVYLAIFVYVFYFVVTYTINIIDNDTMPSAFTFAFWWIVFTPITQVGTIFLVRGVYIKFANYIIETFNIPLPKKNES